MAFKRLSKVRVQWAKRLLKAKYFVVMTDTGSAIMFEGVDPDSFGDVMALASQKAEIEQMYEDLGELVKDHERALLKLTGVDSVEVKKVKKPISKTKVARKASTKGQSKEV